MRQVDPEEFKFKTGYVRSMRTREVGLEVLYEDGSEEADDVS